MLKLRPSRRLTNIVLTTLLILQTIAISTFISIQPVSAAPITTVDYVWPGVTVLSPSTGWVTNPPRAYDKQNSTYAWFDYGARLDNEYYQLQTFKSQIARSAPLPKFLGGPVDIKLNWGAIANTRDETYQIDYIVAPSVALNNLVAATGSAKANGTVTYPNVAEPNDGVWTWTDIGNIRIRVTMQATGGTTMISKFFMFECGVTIRAASNPKVYLDPANITDTSKVIGTTTSVSVKVSNISDFYGLQFKLRYDPKILNQVATALGDYYPTTPFIFQNTTDNIHGLISMALSRQSGEAALMGSGSVVTITFKIVGYGLTTLNLYDTLVSDSLADETPHDLADGYFRNRAMPYGARVEVKVPPPEPKDVPFSVDINITRPAGQSGAIGLYSWEFNMTYDKTIITALNVLQGPFLLQNGPVTFDKNIAKPGYVWANATLNGDLPGAWGNGTLAEIQFDIKSDGNSYLNFVASKTKLTRLDYGAAVPFPAGVSLAPPFYSLPVTTLNGDVDVEFVPHDVAVTATTPEATLAYRGYNRDVNITVQNQGGWPENFNVIAYYESGTADVDGYQADAGWEGAVPWTKTGASPYLGAADYPTNYVTASGTNNKIGNFTFQNVPSYGKTLVGVKLYIKTWSTVDDFMYVLVNLRDVGYDTWQTYTVTPISHVAGGTYVVVDIFDNLDTWTEVNNTKVRVQKATLLSTDTVGIDHMYLVTESRIGTTQAVSGLPVGNFRTLTFTWDTAGVAYGDYKVFGRATTVYGETDIADNILQGGVVRMTIPGDVNGDKTVNVFDILAVKSRWGRTPTSPDWIPEYDANVDDAINVFDILTVKANWGKSW